MASKIYAKTGHGGQLVIGWDTLTLACTAATMTPPAPGSSTQLTLADKLTEIVFFEASTSGNGGAINGNVTGRLMIKKTHGRASEAGDRRITELGDLRKQEDDFFAPDFIYKIRSGQW